MPELRFDTHFQSDGLPVPAHKRIVVAVSGGSDSLALLYLLHDWQRRSETVSELFVATVNHGLRSEAADEAKLVARLCGKLGLPHSTLVWEKPADCTASSQAARDARYQLLCGYAHEVGATCIVLGHTMDDQVETLVMRAAREGSTRGLSGMQLCTHYANPDWRVCLFRPLLGVRRGHLQDCLSVLGVEWIRDPSNENIDAERVRVRKVLGSINPLPSGENIARLANLSARMRSLLATRTASFLVQHTVLKGGECGSPFDAHYVLQPLADCSGADAQCPEIAETFAILVMAAGGKPYRVSLEKLTPLVDRYISGQRVRMVLGRCLVTTGKHGARFEREERNLPPAPEPEEHPVLFDGRWVIAANQCPARTRPFIVGLERFLPASDFPVRRALMKIASRLT